MDDRPEGKTPSASFMTGAIALAFLITGYQTALFVYRAAVVRIVSEADRPDTVYVYADGPADRAVAATAETAAAEFPGRPEPSRQPASGGRNAGPRTERRNAPHAPAVQAVREAWRPPRRESFPFDPNTVSVEDLQRLGFSRKQAEAIDRYRAKGGRYRRKEDFAKSFVVADSVYDRLAPYIDIPLLDLNVADSAAFDALPGIGPYFAARMVAFRKELGGYSFKEQLLDIRGFDAERYDGLADLVTVGPAGPYPLWTAPEERLARHPYIGRRAARGIVLYREHHPRTEWTLEKLDKAGVLDAGLAEKLFRCRIEEPGPSED